MEDFEETVHGDCVVVGLCCRLDSATTPRVQQALLDRVRAGQKYLALDFDRAGLLASSGLRMLLVLARATTEFEGRLVLCGLDATARDTLEVTGFLPNFSVTTDAAAALALLQV